MITHPIIPLTLSSCFPRNSLSPAVILAGVVCSAAPDVDVLGFAFGISYEDFFGHRGFTHSILAAAILAGLAAVSLRIEGSVILVFLFLFSSTLSHGIFDAITDGGLGVAFFSPFENGRYFFPWRPILVSPIGAGIFSEWGWRALKTELQWVWLPCGIIFVLSRTFPKARAKRT